MTVSVLIYLPKGIVDSYVIISGKGLYDLTIDSDIKPYEEIEKLTVGYYWMFIRLWLYQ